MNQALTERTLSDLALSLPGSTELFLDYQLDFCCDGQRSLREASRQQGLDAEQIAGQLQALPRGEVQRDWRQSSNDELIDHILERFHQVHRQQFPDLIPLAEQVERTHGAHPACPTGLSELLRTLHQELEGHMCKEESVLFPWLRQNIPLGHVQGPIGVMRHEHDEHAETLARLTQLTNQFTPPVDACNSWRQLYAALEVMRRDLMQHIHLENNLLFVGANRYP